MSLLSLKRVALPDLRRVAAAATLGAMAMLPGAVLAQERITDSAINGELNPTDWPSTTSLVTVTFTSDREWSNLTLVDQPNENLFTLDNWSATTQNGQTIISVVGDCRTTSQPNCFSRTLVSLDFEGTVQGGTETLALRDNFRVSRIGATLDTPDTFNGTNSIRLNITFDEPVTGFGLEDLEEQFDGTFSNLSGSGANYQVTVSPDGSAGSLSVRLVQDGAVNALGLGIDDDRFFQSADRPPTIRFSDAPSEYTDTSPVAFNVTASESWSDLGNDPSGVLDAQGVSDVQFAQVDEFTYAVTATPIGTGPMAFLIPDGAASDLDGNPNTQVSASIADAKQPVGTLVVPTDFSETSPVELTATFDEAVSLNNSNAVVLQNATLDSIAVSGSVVTIAVLPDGSDDVTVSIGEGLVADADGNLSTSIAAQSITAPPSDQAPPVATISPDSYNYTEPFEATITFNEDLDETRPLALASLSVNHARLSGLRRINSNQFSFMVAPDGINDVVITLAAGAVQDLAGNGNEQAELTITNSGYVEETVKAIAEFMVGRGTQILGNRPDYTRLAACDRDPSGGFNLASGDSGLNGSFDASHCTPLSEHWSAWINVAGSIADYDGNRLRFGVGQIGIQNRIRENLILGMMAQLDYAHQENDGAASDVEGTGFMVGPYAVWQVPETNSTLAVEASWGRSYNTVNPVGLYSDDFDTTRFLVAGTYSDDFDVQNWRISPGIGARYYRDKQGAYVDTVGYTIPEQTIAIGEAEFAAEVGREWLATDGTYMGLSAKLGGIYTFQMQANALGDNPVVDQGSLRPRLDLSFTARRGLGFVTLTGFHDGLGVGGSGDYQSYGVGAELGWEF